MLLRFLKALMVCLALLATQEAMAPAQARESARGHAFQARLPAPTANRRPVVEPGRAFAQGCLSQRQIRAAVQSGQAQSLSNLIGRIRAQAGGDILPNPQLCQSGGRLVYLINVLTGAGKVLQLTVDAANGAILGY